jgi:hypothetical protein
MITDPDKNKMIVNGKEVIYTDDQMRDFYESFLEGHCQAYYNLHKHYRETKYKLNKEINELKLENTSLALTICDLDYNYNKYKKWYNDLKNKLPDIIGKQRAAALLEEVETYEEE